MIDRLRLEQIMREAGAIARAQWPGDGHKLASWDKEPGHPVSDADLAVDRFLQSELSALLPSAGWLSEETADDRARLDCDLCWLVDPIDGTRDYIRGRTGWSVSVALVSSGKPLIGSLVAPARDEVWSAVAGQGAWRNGALLAASSRRQLDGARIPIDDHVKLQRPLQKVDKPNSIALRIAMIAADEADVMVGMRWGHEWDLAAAALIAREAGAQVTDVLGQPLSYNKHDPRAFGVLASARGIHEEAREWLRPMAEKIAGETTGG